MSVVRGRLVRALVATLAMPHELGYAAPAWVCRLDPEVAVLPSWRGETVPLARFNADLDPDTPVVLIRAVAVAPLAIALLAAGLVGTVLPRDSLLVVPLLAVLSFWGSLSSGDPAIAANPRLARDHGEFLAPKPPRIDTAALTLTSLTVVLVGLLLLA